MDAVDSKTQELGLTDILSIVNRASDTGVDLRTFVLQTVLMTSMPTNKFLKLGNTVFIMIDGGDRMANIIVYNADTPENLLENYIRALNAAYMLGFDQIFVNFDEDFYPFYDELTDTYKAEDYGYELQRLDDDSYRLIMRLGPERQGEVEA